MIATSSNNPQAFCAATDIPVKLDSAAPYIRQRTLAIRTFSLRDKSAKIHLYAFAFLRRMTRNFSNVDRSFFNPLSVAVGAHAPVTYGVNIIQTTMRAVIWV